MVPISTWMFTESDYEWWLLVAGHLNADKFVHLNAKCLHVFCSSYLANYKFHGKQLGQNCCFLTNTFQENYCNISFDFGQCSCNDCYKTVLSIPAWIWIMVDNLQLCHCSSVYLSGYRKQDNCQRPHHWEPWHVYHRSGNCLLVFTLFVGSLS